VTRAGSDAAAGAALPRGQPGPPSSAWDVPPRHLSAATPPTLAVDGFEGPLDGLLALARARKVDLARLSILALVEAFGVALDAALRRTPDAPAPDLAQWAAWTVMAAQLAELRSRLLLPADAAEARTAQAEAEALRRQWMRRAEMAAAADWLERRPLLGRDVFARGQSDRGRAGRPAESAGLRDGGETDGAAAAVETPSGVEDVSPVAGGDLTDLLRACLVALRLPPHAEAYQPQRLPFWSVGDAAARITRLLDGLPGDTELAAFLPKIAEADPDRQNLHGRAALAATFVAGLELARDGALTLQQDEPWQVIRVQRHAGGPPDAEPKPTAKGERLQA